MARSWKNPAPHLPSAWHAIRRDVRQYLGGPNWHALAPTQMAWYRGLKWLAESSGLRHLQIQLPTAASGEQNEQHRPNGVPIGTRRIEALLRVLLAQAAKVIE